MISSYFATYIYYVMSCVRPQLGADCFHPKWAVDSSYSWNIHCFQIRWHSHRSAGIGIEKQLGTPSQCCNESRKYCHQLQPTTKKSAERALPNPAHLDPIPTWLLKDCLIPLLPVFTKIIILSLSGSIMSEDFKNASLLKLVKKIQLDIEILKNFRPIFNLAYISKLIENIVDSQMTSHMTVNDLHDMMQSSYKENHSTETAMLRVHNDILTALDQNKSLLIICMDLSAAFDTVDPWNPVKLYRETHWNYTHLPHMVSLIFEQP